MTNVTDPGPAGVDPAALARAHHLVRRNAADDDRPAEFDLLGRRWTLLADVFSPAITPVTEVFTGWLPFPTTSFLEMGCGAGVTAVSAALAGCLAVTAVDITAAAVANTRRNAERHGVADRVRVVRSDMFAELAPDDRYDMIFWNSNFVEAPPDFVNATPLHHAMFDPAYRAHRAFVQDAPRHLAPGGRLLLGFSSLGSGGHLERLCAEAGLRAVRLRTERRELEVPIEFQLLELVPAGGTP
jgi:release factor glutamine methyltransferase